MLTYFIVGTLWSWWLEYYTTKNLEGIMGMPWVWTERLFHISLWPVSLGTFIYAMYKEFKRRK